MFHRMNRLYLQFPLKILSVLVLHLLLTCRGQFQLIGPSQPIVATVGDDIMLLCHLHPAEDVAALAVDWTRPDLDTINVHVRRAGQDVITAKHPSYKGRTSLSINGLKQGDLSLKLSKVKLSDEGKYRCFILQLNKESFVELVVVSDAVSPPFINLAGLDRDRGGVVLQCESKGWHPQPEVFWLDGEGNLLSAGPTETVRGPDGLYTVSSRVTVEKRHSNNMTCRVQQNKINQTRETYIIVADDFFKAQSSSSPAVIGLAVSLVVCIVFFVFFFFGRKWIQNMIKTKRSCRDETDGGGNKNLSKSDDPEMQPLNVVDIDGEMSIVTTALSEENKGKKEKKNKTQTKHTQYVYSRSSKNSTEVFMKIDPHGEYLRLTNKSKEDLKLEGWKLRLKLNHENPIMFTFEESFTLRAEKKVKIWVPGFGFHSPPSNLTWMDLNRWAKGDKLLVELIKCHEEIVTTTEL